MTVRVIRNSWWVDLRFNGTRYRVRSPENSRTGARAYEFTLRQKLTRGESIHQRTSAAEQHVLLEEFAWKWFDEYVVPNNRAGERRQKTYILRSSLIPFFGKMPIKRISSQHIEQYKAKRLLGGLSKKTINNHLTVLRKCLTTAYDWLQIDGAPPKIIWLKAPPPKTDYLTSNEGSLLLSRADGVTRELIMTALRTGMRRGELTGLQWESIDWQNRSVVVRHSRCEYTKELNSPKSNRERHIPLDNEVYEMLLLRRQATGYVFVSRSGRIFNSTSMRWMLRKICRAAGLRMIGWHTFRHTFASHLVKRGVPLAAVQVLMGHSTISMTMRYAHVAPSTLRAAIDLLNPGHVSAANDGQPVGNAWQELQIRDAA